MCCDAYESQVAPKKEDEWISSQFMKRVLTCNSDFSSLCSDWSWSLSDGDTICSLYSSHKRVSKAETLLQQLDYKPNFFQMRVDKIPLCVSVLIHLCSGLWIISHLTPPLTLDVFLRRKKSQQEKIGTWLFLDRLGKLGNYKLLYVIL